MNPSPYSDEVTHTPQLNHMREVAAVSVLLLAVISAAVWWYLFPFRKSHELLHVSFDAARTAFPPIDHFFENHMLTDHCRECFISTHFAGSIQQANGVASGLIADVASFASPMEVIQIQKKGDTVATDWASLYPYGSSPFYSTIVWVVKPGVDLSSKSWSALLDSSIHPCMPDPDASGAGRYAYFAILAGFLEEQTDSSAGAYPYPSADKLLLKTDITGDRASVTSRHFLKTTSINLLITWESEAIKLMREHPSVDLKMVYPAVCIMTEPVVVELTDHTTQRNTEDFARQYLEYLYTAPAQEHFAQAGFRPRDPQVFERFREQFPAQELQSLPSFFDSWDRMLEEAFGPKGHFLWIQQIRAARMGGAE